MDLNIALFSFEKRIQDRFLEFCFDSLDQNTQPLRKHVGDFAWSEYKADGDEDKVETSVYLYKLPFVQGCNLRIIMTPCFNASVSSQNSAKSWENLYQTNFGKDYELDGYVFLLADSDPLDSQAAYMTSFSELIMTFDDLRNKAVLILAWGFYRIPLNLHSSSYSILQSTDQRLRQRWELRGSPSFSWMPFGSRYASEVISYEAPVAVLKTLLKTKNELEGAFFGSGVPMEHLRCHGQARSIEFCELEEKDRILAGKERALEEQKVAAERHVLRLQARHQEEIRTLTELLKIALNDKGAFTTGDLPTIQQRVMEGLEDHHAATLEERERELEEREKDYSELLFQLKEERKKHEHTQKELRERCAYLETQLALSYDQTEKN